MDIQFNGDTAAISPKAEEVCKRILQDIGYTKCVVEVNPVGKKGDNYCSSVISFITQQENVNNGETLKMIAKLAPSIEETRQVLNITYAFSNEIIVYSELLPKYQELQDGACIPKKDQFKYPICHSINDEIPNEVIVLEDIRDRGYEILNRFVTMSNEQVKLALTDIAKYHALSFVLKAKNPVFFDRISKKLVNLWTAQSDTELFVGFLTNMENEMMILLKNENYKKRINGLLTNMVKSTSALHKVDLAAKTSVIVQGDCWTNNMMFKITNNTPTDVILLDYQACKLASPASDILYFILSCTDYDTRKAHYFDWLDHYYKSLDDFLSEFNIKANYVYPREKLDADLQMNGKTSFAISCVLANMLVREPEDVFDIHEFTTLDTDNFNITNLRETISDRLSLRMDGLIKSCIEFGYI